MSIMHRRRAIMERIEASTGGKRKSAPAEFARASELPPVDHDRAPASSRGETPATVAPAVVKPKKKAKRARKG